MREFTFGELETLFLALGDKTRLKLLALMADGPVAVGLLADRLDESQPKVSRHLAYLRNAGVVNTRRDGKWIYYGIDYPADAAMRRILDTVVQSIAVMRIDGTDTYFTEDPSTHEGIEVSEEHMHDEIYGQSGMELHFDGQAYDIEAEQADHEELDVFLL